MNTVLLPLYVLTLGTSAFLLFWVQPLFARMALPLLGGAPVVWNTAMVFFQAALLGGYLYAHISTRMLGLRRQAILHAMLIAGALTMLPIGISGDWIPPADGWPIPWLLSLLAIGVGLPFFALSATAPLLQKWFVHTGHRDSGDPYFLYSASNIGSVTALLAYPVVAEPMMTLSTQSRVWTGVYVLFLGLIAACAALTWRRITVGGEIPPAEPGDTATGSDTIAWRRRLHWIVLAFVPSSLLLGVTTHLTTDVAAVPLFWVVPLALYLLTFVIVFARRPILRHEWMVRALPILLIPMVATPFWKSGPLAIIVPIHLINFFVLTMVCHGELARRRPNSRSLTEFYVWMSVGGMLGGVFTAIIAPVLFDSVMEYPLAIAAACALRPLVAKRTRRAAILDIALPACVLVVVLGATNLIRNVVTTASLDTTALVSLTVLSLVPLALLVFSFSGRPLRFALGISALLFAGITMFPNSMLIAGSRDLVHAERSYFGVYRVLNTDQPQAGRILLSGTTLHGVQTLGEDSATRPTSYYHPAGPLGQMLSAWRSTHVLHTAGVVGLGAGATACYQRPGENWIFYEIDPTVAEIAQNASLFTYLQRCGIPTIELGDARLTLNRMPDATFDILIIDAFSSDAIPMHLLTIEAIRLFLSKLTENGILVFHISNKYFDLRPILARQADAVGAVALAEQYNAPADVLAEFGFPSVWMVLSPRESAIAALLEDERWHRATAGPDTPLWTDGYSDILSVLRLSWPRLEYLFSGPGDRPED